MKAALGLAARLFALSTLALVLVAIFVTGRLELAARIYALVLAGTMLIVTLAALRRAYPAATPLRPRARRSGATRPEPPATLARLEHECALGIAGSFDLHYRLRPRLRDLAGALLASRHGISLDENPDASLRALGEKTWELVRADRLAPEDRLARGAPLADLRETVESLESL